MQAHLLHLRATSQTRVCPFQLRELQGSIILWQEAPKVDMEEGAYLSQGALSLVWALEDDKEKQKKHKGLTNEDRCEYERVFETFFESICPRARVFHHTMID